MEFFKNLLNEYITCIDVLIEVEDRKLECISKNNIAILGDIMKEEQALSLKLRGLDIKRDKWQKESCYDSLTFKQIIEKLPSNNADFYKLYEILNSKLKQLDSGILSSKKLIEVHLHNVGDALSSINVKTQQSYNSNGKPRKSAFSSNTHTRV